MGEAGRVGGQSLPGGILIGWRWIRVPLLAGKDRAKPRREDRAEQIKLSLSTSSHLVMLGDMEHRCFQELPFFLV